MIVSLRKSKCTSSVNHSLKARIRHLFFLFHGFCVYNDMAVASGVAMRDYGERAWPILIIDLDVHQVRPPTPVRMSASCAPLLVLFGFCRPCAFLLCPRPEARGCPQMPPPDARPLARPVRLNSQGNGTASIFENDPRVRCAHARASTAVAGPCPPAHPHVSNPPQPRRRAGDHVQHARGEKLPLEEQDAQHRGRGPARRHGR